MSGGVTGSVEEAGCCEGENGEDEALLTGEKEGSRVRTGDKEETVEDEVGRAEVEAAGEDVEMGTAGHRGEEVGVLSEEEVGLRRGDDVGVTAVTGDRMGVCEGEALVEEEEDGVNFPETLLVSFLFFFSFFLFHNCFTRNKHSCSSVPNVCLL
jgi:hypothetical protein